MKKTERHTFLVFALELLREEVDETIVKIFSTKMGITSSGPLILCGLPLGIVEICRDSDNGELVGDRCSEIASVVVKVVVVLDEMVVMVVVKAWSKLN